MSDPKEDFDFETWEEEWDRAIEEKVNWFEQFTIDDRVRQQVTAP